MRTNKPSPEEVFYNSLYNLIHNLLIANPNYENGYHYNGTVGDLIRETKERASYILGRMEETKHLIIDED